MVWFMGLFWTGRHPLHSRRCREHSPYFGLTTTWQESTDSQKTTSHHLGNVHKSHLIKHKNLVHEIRLQKPFFSRESLSFAGKQWRVFFTVSLGYKKRTRVPFTMRHVFFKKHYQLSTEWQKGWAAMLLSLGHITMHQWFAISKYAAFMLFGRGIEKINSIPTLLKGINKCIHKENCHKHKGFHSDCRDADESTECTWRARLRAGGDRRAHRVIRWGQRARAIFRPHHHLSQELLLDF